MKGNTTGDWTRSFGEPSWIVSISSRGLMIFVGEGRVDETILCVGLRGT